MNTQQRRFVEAYLTTAAGNATAAAKTAGYSVKTAHSIGSRLLKHVEVRQALDARSTALAAKTEHRAHQLIAEVESVAFTKADVTERGKMKALELLGRYHRLWQDKAGSSGSGITVNIGYIGVAPAPHADLPLAINVTPEIDTRIDSPE